MKRIVAPIREKGGNIIGFQLSNKMNISRQEAMREAREGRLIGINLYPGFVQEVAKRKEKRGLLKKILQGIRGKG